jgi:hypothetical protein
MFTEFAGTLERAHNEMLARCSAFAATSEEMLDLLEVAPVAQRRPLLLFAAVHYLLLRGIDSPLARHYPTVHTLWRRDPGDPAPPDEDPVPAFVELCRAERGALAELLATRAVQTNEVGRCTALLPAFATVAQRARRPLALVDLGTSAGLNLLFDHSSYDYGTGLVGAAGSPVHLECTLRGSGVPPATVPPVAHRAGVDQHPIDVDDPDQRCWLLACIWPADVGRFARLQAALGIARTSPDRPSLHRGDLVEAVATQVAAAPPDAQVCLFHSWTAAYLDPPAQAALCEAIAAAAADRPVAWVFAEQPDEVPALPVPPPPDGTSHPLLTALVLVEAGGPAIAAERAHRLGDVHPHGRWLRWWEPTG